MSAYDIVHKLRLLYKEDVYNNRKDSVLDWSWLGRFLEHRIFCNCEFQWRPNLPELQKDTWAHTIAKIHLQRYICKDTIAKIQSQGYNRKDTIARIQLQRYNYKDTWAPANWQQAVKSVRGIPSIQNIARNSVGAIYLPMSFFLVAEVSTQQYSFRHTLCDTQIPSGWVLRGLTLVFLEPSETTPQKPLLKGSSSFHNFTYLNIHNLFSTFTRL